MKDRRARLRAMFARLKQRGQNVKDRVDNFRERRSEAKYAKHLKKTGAHDPLYHLEPNEREVIEADVKLMHDLGMLKDEYTEDEIRRRVSQHIYASEIEKLVRRQIEEEYADKYQIQKSLLDVAIGAMTGLPIAFSTPKYKNVDISLKDVGNQQLSHIATRMIKDRDDAVDATRLKELKGEVTTSEATLSAKDVAEKIKERREKKKAERRLGIRPRTKSIDKRDWLSIEHDRTQRGLK